MRSTSRAPAGHTFSAAAETAADWTLTHLEDTPAGLRLSVRGPDEGLALESPLLGTMNARNLLGVAALCRQIGLSADDVRAAARAFHGVRRRQEIVVQAPITLIDDFAHHPTAIAATLDAVRSRYPGRRVWALFDPRSNTSRRRVFQHELAAALAAADMAVIGPVFAADRLPSEQRFSPPDAAREIAAAGGEAIVALDHDAVVDAVESGARADDVVVALSNGAFGGVVVRLKKAFETF